MIILIIVIALLIVCILMHEKKPMSRNSITEAGKNRNDNDVPRDVNDADEYQFNGQ